MFCAQNSPNCGNFNQCAELNYEIEQLYADIRENDAEIKLLKKSFADTEIMINRLKALQRQRKPLLPLHENHMEPLKEEAKLLEKGNASQKMISGDGKASLEASNNLKNVQEAKYLDNKLFTILEEDEEEPYNL